LYLGHRLLGEKVGGPEIVAVAGVVISVAVLAWAAPAETSHHAAAGRLALGLVPLAAIALSPLLVAPVRRPPSVTLPFACGAAFAFTGIVSKLLVDDLRNGNVDGVVLWIALVAVLGFTGLLLEMTALQQRPAVHVGPMVFVV